MNGRENKKTKKKNQHFDYVRDWYEMRFWIPFLIPIFLLPFAGGLNEKSSINTPFERNIQRTLNPFPFLGNVFKILLNN